MLCIVGEWGSIGFKEQTVVVVVNVFLYYNMYMI